MRVPIIQQHTSRALVVPGRCEACGAEQGFDVAHRQLRIWLAFLPMGGSNLSVEGRCKACGAPAPKRVLDGVKVPFVIRFGWLFFLVLPLVAAGGYYFIDNAIRRAEYEKARLAEEDRQRSKEREEKDRTVALADCEDAYKKASAAKAACFKSLDDVENAITKDISKEKPRPPSDVSLLKNAPIAGVGSPLVPDSPYLGHSACALDVPYDFEITSACYRLYQDGSVAAVRAKTKETIDATKAFELPERWAVVTFTCGDSTCSSSAYWIDKPTKKILALARVTKAKTDAGADGKDGDKGALQKSLGDALAKWK